MVLPVQTFTDPRLAQPIQPHGLNLALQSGMQFAKQLQQMKQQAATAQQTAAMAPLRRQYLTGQVATQPYQQQLLQAQAKEALAKAAQPFAGQHLIGPAGEAQSDIQFAKRYGNDPVKMALLHHAEERKMRMANARLFGMLPVAERGRWVATARTLGYTPYEAIDYGSKGYTLEKLAEWKKAGKKPPVDTEIPTAIPGVTPGVTSGTTPSTHPAENFSNAHLPQANADVNRNTAPINANEIKPTYPAETGVITAQQKAASATAGMDYLGQKVKNGLNYGGLFSVVTRPWYWDANSKNPANQEKAIKYYAAQSLKPELALYRVRIQQGQASARIVRELSPTILGKVSTNLSYLPAKIQKRVQQRVMDVLNEATVASSRQVTGTTPTTFAPPRTGAKRTIPVTKQAVTPTAKSVALKAGWNKAGTIYTAKDGSQHTWAQLQGMKK